MKKCIFIFRRTALLSLFLSSLVAQDYEWPTEASDRITSTYGDTRPRRYHAGIDISTNGARGYAIYAIDDGYIERVLVSTKGYGRTIYLRLKDKNVAVYAHLESLMPALDRYVHAEQMNHGKWNVDVRFKQSDFPVLKGDVIGHTGDTGTISGPHLHFEIRDRRNIPINPLTNGLSFFDDLRPEFISLAVIPLSPKTTAHGSQLPSILKARKVKAGRYIIQDTIAVDGPFGLAVEAFDRLPGSRYQQTVYGLSLTIDGKQHYGIQFERYRFPEGQLMELEREYSLRRLYDDDYHRLFIPSAGDSPTFVDKNSKGAINLKPGYHRFTIKTWDKDHNTSILRGTLAFTPKSEMEVSTEWSDQENGWIITINSSTPLRQYHAFLFSMRGQLMDRFDFRADDLTSKQRRFVIPRHKGQRRIVQIVGIDRWGARLEPVHISLMPVSDVTTERNFTFSTAHNDKGVIMQISSDLYLPTPPELLLRTKHGIRLVQTKMVSPVDFVTPSMYFAELDGLEEIIVRVELDPPYEVRMPVISTIITPNARGRMSDKARRYIIEYLSSTFYDSTFVWFNPSDVEPPPQGRFIITPINIGPTTRPYKGPMGIQMIVPPNRVLPNHAGIFYLDKKEGWTFMKGAGNQSRELQIGTRAFRTLATSGEIFALIEENEPPVIEMKLPRDGGRYRASDISRIRFTVKDELAGIKDETAITLTLDGKPRIFEYVFSRKTVFYTLPEPLAPGNHEIIVSAIDLLGNRIVQNINFEVL